MQGELLTLLGDPAMAEALRVLRRLGRSEVIETDPLKANAKCNFQAGWNAAISTLYHLSSPLQEEKPANDLPDEEFWERFGQRD